MRTVVQPVAIVPLQGEFCVPSQSLQERSCKHWQLFLVAAQKKLRVYDTQTPFYYDTCAYPLPDLLKATGWIEVELSQYKPNKPIGKALATGVTNQNLECLTFADESLDLVITSDVMEHARLDDRVHREIYRVLKPGGI